MPTLNRATRGASRIGAILTALFLVAMLLPGAALAANTVTPATGGRASPPTPRPRSPGTAPRPLIGRPVGDRAGDTRRRHASRSRSPGGVRVPGRRRARPASVGRGLRHAGRSAATSVTRAPPSITTRPAPRRAPATLTFVRAPGPSDAPGTRWTAGSITASGLASGAAGALGQVAGAAILILPDCTEHDGDGGRRNLATQPIVHSQDQFGNPRTGDSIALITVPSARRVRLHGEPQADHGSGRRRFAELQHRHRGLVRAPRVDRGRAPVDSRPSRSRAGAARRSSSSSPSRRAGRPRHLLARSRSSRSRTPTATRSRCPPRSS